ncbi:MAG: Trm112 family protein [Candidatus Diapherotrites archaeon]
MKKAKKEKHKELSKELLEVLACPACKSDLKYLKAQNKLKCVKCKREYKIEDGIPVMLLED